MKISVSPDGDSIELESADNVFQPSSASTALIHAVNDKDIKGKTVADIGCGTGYLGLGLLSRGASYLYGTDIQSDAIKLADENASKNHFEKQASFHTGNFFEPFAEYQGLKGSIDVIISNPPQTPIALVSNQSPSTGMIDGGPDGNKYILKILDEARHWLKSDGILYIPVFSYSNPDKTKAVASSCFKQVEKIAEHDIIFGLSQFAIYETIRDICNKGKGYIVTHYGHPYRRIEILRCQYPVQ